MLRKINYSVSSKYNIDIETLKVQWKSKVVPGNSSPKCYKPCCKFGNSENLQITSSLFNESDDY